mmetsp:Transcript_33057/g.80326  ORF Transcript_33057/g.80326 Transcript_33057/m.80326 type:complete len:112 (+) Transcript_33057:908-1243(+)
MPAAMRLPTASLQTPMVLSLSTFKYRYLKYRKEYRYFILPELDKLVPPWVEVDSSLGNPTPREVGGCAERLYFHLSTPGFNFDINLVMARNNAGVIETRLPLLRFYVNGKP